MGHVKEEKEKDSENNKDDDINKNKKRKGEKESRADMRACNQPVCVCVGVLWKVRWKKACSVRLGWRAAACRWTHLLPRGRPCAHLAPTRSCTRGGANAAAVDGGEGAVGMALARGRSREGAAVGCHGCLRLP